MRYTKIVATLGPASSSSKVIKQLIQAGVEIFRLNFSHGTHDSHRELIQLIREVSANIKMEVGILQDLCGPKIRVGTMQDGEVTLEDGASLVFTNEKIEGTSDLIPCEYQSLSDDVKPGERILLDDGSMELVVTEVTEGKVHCTVNQGGILKDHKGMNLPETTVSSPALTEKDKADLQFGLQEGVDFVALSFVRDPEDLHQLRAIIKGNGKNARIIAKIEKPEAIDKIDEIIDATDGIMVARGDLGVEMDVARVPILQREIIHRANAADRYVITATQMLESMIHHPYPTRAEVSDVSTAVRDGTDAVMLSGESAAGEYPVKAVETMDHIIRVTEEHIAQKPPNWDWARINPETEMHDAIGHAVLQLWKDMDVKVIATFTTSGGTAIYLSKSRPFSPIIVFTPNLEALRRMKLFWGVLPVLDTTIHNNYDLVHRVNRRVQEMGFAKPLDNIIVIQSSGIGKVGKNNIIEIRKIEAV
jgi:pyruvate kinase